MRKLSQIWFEVQEVLFPFIEKESTRLERQQSMATEEMLEELPKVCDVGD